jgi:hypothetical protein
LDRHGHTDERMSGAVDMPDAEYRAMHDSLSYSGAKLLLPPNCPALYRWQRDHPPEPKPHYEFGHAAHKQVLGVGHTVRYIDAKDWRTKAAQQAAADARAAGEIPLLEEKRGIIEGMAEALRAHPVASKLLEPGTGKAEQSLFWVHRSGVKLRGRLDWLPEPRAGRMVIPDYKTADSANPIDFAKSAANYRYHQQDTFYSDLVVGAGIAQDPAFVFIVQEKTAPYLVSVIELDAEAKRIGRELNERAIRIFKHCTENDIWPGYSTDVELVGLPVWYQRQHEETAA